MKVVKKTVSLLVLSDLKDVRNRRKFSLRLLVIHLLIMAGFFYFLSGSSSPRIKLFLIIFILLLLIPGILLIRFDTSESNNFTINIGINKIIHKRRKLFKNQVYIAKYSIKNINFIAIKKIGVNSNDGKNYRVRLYFKTKKYIDIGYFDNPEKSFKIAKTISKFMKIPLKY